jgi:chromosomal replication initiation ATPase DnaA
MMAEPARRQLDKDLPRIVVHTPEFLKRHREPEIAARVAINQARDAAVLEVMEIARSIIAEAQGEAVRILEAARAAARSERRTAVELPAVSSLPSFSDIVRETAEAHGLLPQHLLGRRKSRQVSVARHEAIARIYRARPDLSAAELGRRFGDRDHSTILKSLRKSGVVTRNGEGK